MNEGLHQRLASKREQLFKSRLVFHGEDTSPQEKHSAEHFIPGAEREVMRMEEEIADGEEAMQAITAALALANKLTMTRHAMLTITALENAASRLRVHLGADPRIEQELEAAKAELARVNDAWDRDRRIFAGALQLLKEADQPYGSVALIEAARRAKGESEGDPLMFVHQSDAELFEAFTACQNVRPHLLIEVGYNRVSDWMVTVWDGTNVGIKDAEVIISTQSPDRAQATSEAAAKLRERFLAGN